MNNEKDSFVLVTGSSSGIGKDIAIGLSKNFNIILHGRDAARLQEVKALCSPNFRQIVWQYDLSDLSKLEADLSSLIANHAIAISKFVHCAGFMKMTPLKISSADLFTTTFNTNVVSAALICKMLVQKKLNDRLNSVVFISSNISNRGAKAMSAYGASKGALDTLMRCLAVELAPRVRLNSVLPGAIISKMTEAIFENKEVRNRMEATYPLGLGKADDIFRTVEFLLSENAAWITGQQITVDGGRSINITG